MKAKLVLVCSMHTYEGKIGTAPLCESKWLSSGPGGRNCSNEWVKDLVGARASADALGNRRISSPLPGFDLIIMRSTA